jgi:aminoglycoside 6'-N-acetyltransferase I
MKIAPASADDADEWAEMRAALWPQMSIEDHRSELAELYLGGNPNYIALLARRDKGEMVGFAEVSLRHDFVNGCETSPVLFLEGIFVRPACRSKGVAKALCEAAADWGRAAGCAEFASDAYLNDARSHAFHRAIGFAETERVVYFRKRV